MKAPTPVSKNAQPSRAMERGAKFIVESNPKP